MIVRDQIYGNQVELFKTLPSILSVTQPVALWAVARGIRFLSHVARVRKNTRPYFFFRTRNVRISHGRVSFDSRNVRQSVTQIIHLWPLPTDSPGCCYHHAVNIATLLRLCCHYHYCCHYSTASGAVQERFFDSFHGRRFLVFCDRVCVPVAKKKIVTVAK